ncbi:MAG: hypothetical protein KAS66_09075 [Candidatus Omnitrophica bacterium]|nr:hypothetical protein [Candidatus Omnitrophota bacterium]
MIKNKEKNILALEASSPEELDTSLTASLQGEDKAMRPVALSVRGPKIIVRPFHLANVPLKDVGHHLLSEAVELMSMTSDEIEFDFQITKSDQDDMRGIYACMSKKVLEDYLLVLDKENLNPIKITEHFLTCVDSLYQQNILNGARVCFLDFSAKNIVNLFVSSNRECELLRKIPFEGLDEAQAEIVQSLRSASAKSWPKHYDGIYYAGDLEGTDELLEKLEKRFDTNVEKVSTLDAKTALCSENTYFGLNLLKNYIFSALESKYIHMGMNIVLTLCVLNIMVSGARIMMKGRAINKVKSSYQVSEYQYAVDLSRNTK